MATTATFTINSADLTGDALSISSTSTFYKAGTTTHLEQTTGLNHKIYTDDTADLLLLNGTDYGTNVAAKVYIANLSTDPTEYLQVNMGPQAMGKLYAGDFLFIPWEQHDNANDIDISPSVATKMPIEWVVFYE